MKSVFTGLLVHERMCSIVSVVCMIIGKKAMDIAKLGDSASFFSLYVGGTPLYLRTRKYQISSIFGHVLKKAMVLSITEKNNVKINLRS